MNDRNNKTSICSIVFLDIIDYSKKTDSEQIEIKNQFNTLINHALKDVAENDRIILDSGDGAAIASNGSPEDVLFISLNIRDEILKNNIHSATPLYVRFGVNLGPVRVVKDINGRPNIIGDGINVAQRIMSFAKPNQILVSRSYYEVTSRLTQEISQMFDYSGVKQDKHVREHEVYSVRLLKEQSDSEDTVSMPNDAAPLQLVLASKKINWKYAALCLPAIIAFFLIVKSASAPSVPAITIDETSASTEIAMATADEIKSAQTKPEALTEKTSKDVLLPNETIETLPSAVSLPVKDTSKTAAKTDVAAVDKTPQELLELELAKKKAKQKAKKKAEEASATEAKPQYGTVHQPEVVAVKTEVKKDESKEKSGWGTFKDSVKQGGEAKCSQAQIAMNQCN
jgi:Adenylate and Guanylate cyclase catalytic domain